VPRLSSGRQHTTKSSGHKPAEVAKGTQRRSESPCARIVHQWVAAIGLDSTVYGTHTMRRTKATLINNRTKNLRAVQLLLGHSKLESTVRYLGIEADDALEISEQTEI
jgi:site-specific recombinase XerD